MILSLNGAHPFKNFTNDNEKCTSVIYYNKNATYYSTINFIGWERKNLRIAWALES